MNLYKISKDASSYEIERATQEEADAFAASLGEGWVATLVQTDVPQPSSEQVMSWRIENGSNIAKQLNVDVLKGNGKINPNLAGIMSNLQFGELSDAKTAIQSISTAILSQALKDKYIALIDAALAQ